jgi:DNA-directed RNA polymerase specialized sigma24 family protein
MAPKKSKKVIVKVVIWNNTPFRVWITPTGEYGGDTEKLIREMKPTIDNIVKKYAASVPFIERDDLMQTLWVATLNMLKSWNPKRSSWGTYIHTYLWMRTISLMRTRSQRAASSWDVDLYRSLYKRNTNLENSEED